MHQTVKVITPIITQAVIPSTLIPTEKSLSDDRPIEAEERTDGLISFQFPGSSLNENTLQRRDSAFSIYDRVQSNQGAPKSNEEI